VVVCQVAQALIAVSDRNYATLQLHHYYEPWIAYQKPRPSGAKAGVRNEELFGFGDD